MFWAFIVSGCVLAVVLAITEIVMKIHHSSKHKKKHEEFKQKHANDIEIPAEGKRGFILYNIFEGDYFFRIYDVTDKRKFTDYRICTEEIEVEILGPFTALYENADGEHRLGWTGKVLGRTTKE